MNSAIKMYRKVDEMPPKTLCLWTIDTWKKCSPPLIYLYIYHKHTNQNIMRYCITLVKIAHGKRCQKLQVLARKCRKRNAYSQLVGIYTGSDFMGNNVENSQKYK